MKHLTQPPDVSAHARPARVFVCYLIIDDLTGAVIDGQNGLRLERGVLLAAEKDACRPSLASREFSAQRIDY
jgi:hypothetical protein